MGFPWKHHDSPRGGVPGVPGIASLGGLGAALPELLGWGRSRLRVMDIFRWCSYVVYIYIWYIYIYYRYTNIYIYIHSTIFFWCCIMLYDMMSDYIVLYYIIWHYNTLYIIFYIMLCYVMSSYITLYCIILYYVSNV